ncbi:homoserine dehydrogenase [Thermonema lapsum]|uniref:Homoserine dehydrogenase n=1 Tax=Thermonema lapsum TaxID=28195 RepID=A0A846MPL1_9BACT|nr:homoserine dehydrogenase [Thermonema lapsum]NIK73474.1 homoserine dehydrogenase [Thermonema lapsum]
MSDFPVQIGLFGFGCVGQGFYRIFQEQQSEVQAQIRKIVVKNPNKERPIATGKFYFQAQDILNDPTIRLVVEAIDDAEAAYHIAKTALQSGKHVVSANKKMVALYGNELRALAHSQQRTFLYEAAVAGSIPILQLLQHYYRYDRIEWLRGIINGSTNFILSKMHSEGVTYEAALQEAQALGFAESDPTLDVEGFDAVYKLSILLYHAFGIEASPEQLLRQGIHHLDPLTTGYCTRKKYRIKLLAQAYERSDGSLTAFVLPALLPVQDPLASVEQEENAIELSLRYAHRQLLRGKGAGSTPTGAAVMADVARVLKGYIATGKVNIKRYFYEEEMLPLWVSGNSSARRVLQHFPFHELHAQISDAFGFAFEGYARYDQVRDFLQKHPQTGIFVAYHPQLTRQRVKQASTLLSV